MYLAKLIAPLGIKVTRTGERATGGGRPRICRRTHTGSGARRPPRTARLAQEETPGEPPTETVRADGPPRRVAPRASVAEVKGGDASAAITLRARYNNDDPLTSLLALCDLFTVWRARKRSGQTVRTSRASPWPPPPQSAAAPRPPPRRRSSLSSVSTTRVPRHADRVTERDGAAVHVDDVVGDAEVVHRREADRGERLVELEQVDVGDLHARPCRARRLIARDGWVSSDGSGPATCP